MTEKDIRQTLDMVRQREERLDSWMRYLVGLASGALTVLVALQTDKPVGLLPSTCLKVAQVSLGLGILLGAVVLYGRVFETRGLLKHWVRDRSSRGDDESPGEPPSLTVGPNMSLFRLSERACYLSLTIAVISFITLSLCR